MTYKTEYVLPMFSSNLEKEPEIQITGLEVAIRISGYDDEEQFSEVLLKFSISLGIYSDILKIWNNRGFL